MLCDAVDLESIRRPIKGPAAIRRVGRFHRCGAIHGQGDDLVICIYVQLVALPLLRHRIRNKHVICAARIIDTDTGISAARNGPTKANRSIETGPMIDQCQPWPFIGAIFPDEHVEGKPHFSGMSIGSISEFPR